MKAQAWGIWAILCVFFVPDTVFSGGGKHTYPVVTYQQVNSEYISLSFQDGGVLCAHLCWNRRLFSRGGLAIVSLS